MARSNGRPARTYELAWTAKDDALLSRLYDQQPLPVDRLPYTGEFDTLYRSFVCQSGKDVSRHHVFWRLVQGRKDSDEGPNLAKKGRQHVQPSWWE